MTETRTVQPCGMLYSQGREYFLLKNAPVRGDSWESITAYRWVVVPRKIIDATEVDLGEYENVYPFARHIVSTAFTVEFSANMPEIYIQVLEEGATEELHYAEEDNPFQVIFDPQTFKLGVN